MLGMWHVWDIGCWGCVMLGIWNVWDVGCSGCGICDVRVVGCSRCKMFGMWGVQDMECSGCGMLGLCDVRDLGCLGCGMFDGMWDVDLQNARRFFPSFQFIGCIQRNPSRLTLKQLGRKDFSME